MSQVMTIEHGGWLIELTDDEMTALRDAADGLFTLPDHSALTDLVDELKAQVSPSPEWSMTDSV